MDDKQPRPPFALGHGTLVHVESEPRSTACGLPVLARATRRPPGPMCPTCAGYRAAAFGRLITPGHRATAVRARVRLEATIDGISVAGRAGEPAILTEDATALAEALAVRLAERQEVEDLLEARREVSALRRPRLCPHGRRRGECDMPDCTSHPNAATPFPPGEGPRRAD